MHVEESEFDPDGLVVDEPTLLDCMLAALRDRAPGIITWHWSDHSGISTRFGYILIQADGTGIRRDWGPNDLDYHVSDARSGALPEPSMFAQCLMEESDHTRYDCAVWFDLGPPIVVCDEGWFNFDYPP